jgi:uncharacterized membrane protein
MNTGNKIWLLLISIPALICISIIILYSASMAPMTENRLDRTSEDLLNVPKDAGSVGLKPPPLRRMVPSFLLWTSLILTVLVTVPASYYLLSRRLDEKLEKNMKVLLRLMDKGNSISKANPGGLGRNVILKFLNGNQKKVLEKLIEHNGVVLQSEISRMKGMTTLKTHRAIKDLEKKGIIKMESYGKTNRIILTEDVKDILLK